MTEGLPTPKLSDTESLSSYFEQSAAAVQTYTGKFEEQFARPAINTVGTLMGERPIVGIFLSIFTVLSIFPIITVIAASLLLILSFVIAAVIGVLFATLIVLLLLLSFLTASLVVIFIFSAFLTLAAISILVFIRFILLINRLGLTGGLHALYDEVKAKFLAAPIIKSTKGE